MKKLSILTIVLLLVAGVAFAQFDESGLDFSAEASATFGADLDEGVIGISNDFGIDLEWEIIPEGTRESDEEPPVYGWISITDLSVAVEASGVEDEDDQLVDVLLSVEDWEARIIMGPAYLSISDTTFKVDKAGNIVEPGEIEMEDDDYTELINSEDLLSVFGVLVESDPDTEHVGVAVGADLGVAAFELSIASEYDWEQGGTSVTFGDLGFSDDAVDILDDGLDNDSATADDIVAASANDRNLDNAWVLGADVTVNPIEALTVGLTSNMWFGRGGGEAGEPLQPLNPAALGVSVAYDLPFGDLTVTPEAAADFFFQNDAAIGEDGEGFFTDTQIAVGVNVLDADDNGVGLGVVYGIFPGTADDSFNTLGVNFGATEASGDDGFLPILGADLVVNYATLLENEDLGVTDPVSQLAFGLQLSAGLGVAEPYAGIVAGSTQLDDVGASDAIDFGTTVQLGVDITVIPNTTFNIEWLSGDLTADDDLITGYAEDEWIKASGIDSGTTGDKLGVLTITTTIEL